MKTSAAGALCVVVGLWSSGAGANCTAINPSELQHLYPGLTASDAAVLGPALSDVASLSAAENRSLSDDNARSRRGDQLRRQVAGYDAQRQSQRRPADFRSGQALLRSLIRNSPPEPASIAEARAELRAIERGGEDHAPGLTAALRRVDSGLSMAIGRMTRSISAGGSYRMLVDADRLARDHVTDCAAWRTRSGQGLPDSLAALDQHDAALRIAMSTAAAAAAPRIREEIALANDSASIQRISNDYLSTPAGEAAMEQTGIVQALSGRRAMIAAREKQVEAADRSRRDAEAARIAKIQAAATAREEAQERTLLARQRVAQGGARAVSATAAGSAGEPSESQMKAALQANAGRVAGRFGLGDWTKITYFEKVGCEKAQGRIGWQCDYLMRSDGNPMTGFLDAMAGPGTAMRGSARFVLRANGWDSFADQPRD